MAERFKAVDLHSLVYQNALGWLQKACANRNQPVDMVDPHGNTPLLLACYLGNFECVEILVKANASVEAMNYFGQNALALATWGGNLRIIMYLIQLRSYSDFLSSSMIPPICVAIMRKQKTIAPFFRQLTPSMEKCKTVHGVSAMDMVEYFQRLNQKQPAKMRF